MKPVWLMILVLLAAPALAEKGQGQRGEGHRDPERRLAHMQERLGLSDEQVQQIRDNHASGGGREGMRDILTDDQYQQMREMRQKRHGGGRHPGGGHPGGGRRSEAPAGESEDS